MLSLGRGGTESLEGRTDVVFPPKGDGDRLPTWGYRRGRRRPIAGPECSAPRCSCPGRPEREADQRVAAEDKPRLLRPTPTVGDRVSVMGGSVPRCRDRGHERVPVLEHLPVGQCDVLE